MNPAVLTRLHQLKQVWQQRLLMQPISGQEKKETGSTPPRLSPLPDPKAVK